MQTLSKEGHIYLIRAVGTNRYKIGLTQSGRMAKRFDELNSSQSAYPLEIVRVIDVQDRYEVEAELHQKFKAHRVHGEWFTLSREKLAEVERAMVRYENPTAVRGSSGNWRIFSFIMGIILLLMAWESYQGNRVRQSQPFTNYLEQGE